MNRKTLSILFLFFVITSFFFYKTMLKGYVPYPGDLQISEYKPWSTYSYLGYNPGSYPNKAQYFDVIRQLYPWKTLVISELKAGHLPLWNPYNFSGSPLLANLQSAVFYPSTILYLLFPMSIAWSLSIFLQPLLASFFTYLYCKKLNLSISSSVFAGVAYGFSLFVTVFLEYNTMIHVVLWLPLILWSIETFISKQDIRFLIIYIIAICLSAFAGHLQLFFAVIIFTHIYFFVRTKKKSHLSILFILCSILAIGITTIQFLPTLELLKESARVNQPYDFLVNTLLIQPKQLLMLLIPDIFGNPATRNYVLQDSYPGKAMYVGFTTIIFSLIALKFQRKNPLVRFYSISVVVLLLLLVRSPISEIFYRLNLPIIGSSSPSNFIFLLSFSISIIAGYGYEYFLREKKRWYVFPVFTTGLIILLFLFSKNPQFLFSGKNILLGLIFSSLSLVIFIIGSVYNLKKYAGYGLIVLLIIDLFYFFQKFNPFVPAEIVYPETTITSWLKEHAELNRFWGYGGAAVEANIATTYNIYSPDGYDPLYPKAYGEFIQSSQDGEIPVAFTNATRSDARVASGFGEMDFVENQFRRSILNISGTKYILNRVENGTTQHTFPPDEFSTAFTDKEWTILKNNKALPRIFLSPVPYTMSDDKEYEKIFSSEIFSSIITEPTDENSIKLLQYSPQNIKMHVTTAADTWLVITDTYFPGWRAYVDSSEVQIAKSLWTYRAIPVPAGQHTILFQYRPESFTFGIITSGISFCLLLVLFGWMRIIYSRKKNL